MRGLTIKFLHCVRIHSGECCAFTRVSHNGVLKDQLMTNESDFFAQADLGKALRSTYERKIMSTKTLRKRVALVAEIGRAHV